MNKTLESLIYNFLNESKMHLTIDRNTILAVSSICSRNRATNAENIKPMAKWDKDMLLKRYVAALIVMKKPCPQTPEDIEKIGTFKFIGKKALEMGVTIDDINDMYDQNTTSTWRQKHSISFERNKPTVLTPKKSNDPMAIAEEFIQDIPEELYSKVDDYRFYPEEEKLEPYRLSIPRITEYINRQAKLANYDFKKFAALIKKDFKPMYKAIATKNKTYIHCDRILRWYYVKYMDIIMEIGEENTDLYLAEYWESTGLKRKISPIDTTKNNVLKELKNAVIKWHYLDKDYEDEVENIDKSICEYIYENLIVPYVKWKVEKEKFSPTYKKVLKKYNIDEAGTGTFDWFKNNIKNILYNNPDNTITVRYCDWQGLIDRLYYDSKKKKYIMDLTPANDDTDTWDYAPLDDILSCSTSRGYKHHCLGHSYDDLYVTVHRLDDFAAKVYDIVCEEIKYGRLV